MTTVREAVTDIYEAGYRSEFIEYKPEDENHTGTLESVRDLIARQVPDADLSGDDRLDELLAEASDLHGPVTASSTLTLDLITRTVITN